MKIFENNGNNISENVIKLKLKQNIKSLLYNNLVYICVEETDFWQRYDKPARWNWEPTFRQFTVKGHNWLSLAYCDLNSYLVITRLIHKEGLGVFDHEITQTMQFVKTDF